MPLAPKPLYNVPSSHDRRRGDVDEPLNLCQLLSSDQRVSLRQMARYGWRLAFVRSCFKQRPKVVVINGDGKTYGLLESDGSINVEHNLLIRH
ncbi:MAG: hypothetical protein COA42_03990 [Alteromonadaceae bacterium]|nr:MAG: hypothetical protein COA42_03990 [Alteromonadaceae bacterium]